MTNPTVLDEGAEIPWGQMDWCNCVLYEQPWDVDGIVGKNVGEKKKSIVIGNPWIPQSSDSVSQCGKV